MNSENNAKKFYPCFVGLLMVLFLSPGVLYGLAGHWKEGLVWCCWNLLVLSGLYFFLSSIRDTKKYNPRFVGLLFALLFCAPAAHLLSGHWKAGIAWSCGFLALVWLTFFLISIPITLPFLAIVAFLVLFFASLVIYYISLCMSSYRPTRRLGWRGWCVFLFLICSFNFCVSVPLVELMQHYIGFNRWVLYDSMYPTLTYFPSRWKIDRVSVNVWLYRFRDPRRGDIVAIERKDYMWNLRIVGLPGETIDICTPYVLINGEKLLDPPIFTKISTGEGEYSGYIHLDDLGQRGIALPITLGPNEYFMLGDNPYELLFFDSRIEGPFPREMIVGKVTRIISPFWRIREL